eukprot:15364881-Ditylum_brightwellii.AAC.1
MDFCCSDSPHRSWVPRILQKILFQRLFKKIVFKGYQRSMQLKNISKAIQEGGKGLNKSLGASKKDATLQPRIYEQQMEASRVSLENFNSKFKLEYHSLPTVQLMCSPATQKPGQ